jgi:alpha-glucosidase
METPAGPLTLRVYVGKDCKGTLYQDDGTSYDFQQGVFLRLDSTCRVDGGALHVHVGPHLGSYKAWWSKITIEVYGLPGLTGHGTIEGGRVNATWNSGIHAWQTTIPDSGKGMDFELE